MLRSPLIYILSHRRPKFNYMQFVSIKNYYTEFIQKFVGCASGRPFQYISFE